MSWVCMYPNMAVCATIILMLRFMQRHSTLQTAQKSIAPSGYERNPLVRVSTSKGRVLEPDVDYIVTYADTVDIGTATVTIEGIGYYEGTITLHFDIVSEIHSAPPFAVTGDLDGELSTDDARSLADILTGKTEISEGA